MAQQNLTSQRNDAENIILLELFVQQVIVNNQIDRNLANGSTFIDFQFLDNPPIPLEENCKIANKPFCQNNELNLGKSCLFSLTPQEMTMALEEFDIYLNVSKSPTCGNQQKTLIGVALVPLVELLREIIQKLPLNSPDGSPGSSKSIQNSFTLNHPQNSEEVGFVCLFARLTSFGKFIQTQFQMNLEDTSVEYKANDAHYKVKYNKKMNPCPAISCPKSNNCSSPSTCGITWPPSESNPSNVKQNVPKSNLQCPSTPCEQTPTAPPKDQQGPCSWAQKPSPLVFPMTSDNIPNQCNDNTTQPKPCPQFCQPPPAQQQCPQPMPNFNCTKKPVPMVYASEVTYGQDNANEFKLDMGNQGCFCCRMHDETQPSERKCGATYLPPPTMDNKNPFPTCATTNQAQINQCYNAGTGGPPCLQPKSTSPTVVELRPGIDDYTPFRFQVGNCCGNCQNLCVSPPTYEAEDGTKYIEFSDKNRKCFVMRIGKKYEGTMGGGRNNVDLYLSTPPPPDDDVDCQDNNTQYNLKDIPLSAVDKSAKGGNGKKGKGKGKDNGGKSKNKGGDEAVEENGDGEGDGGAKAKGKNGKAGKKDKKKDKGKNNGGTVPEEVEPSVVEQPPTNPKTAIEEFKSNFNLCPCESYAARNLCYRRF